MVAVILINQIVGPVMCKFAIKKVGEDGKAGASNEVYLGLRKVLILGIDGYTLSLASRLQKNHWQVIMSAFDNTLEGEVNKLNEKNIVHHEHEHQTKDAHQVTLEDQSEELPTTSI